MSKYDQEKKMIKFFSNHKDVSYIEKFTGKKCGIIPHPYIEPDWDIEELKEKCSQEIKEAISADELIINGDYTLVSMIVIERHKQNKRTGFICMKKLNEPTAEKDKDGNIIHKNILKPINIRWI